jgi:hypothetical protein
MESTGDQTLMQSRPTSKAHIGGKESLKDGGLQVIYGV